MLGATLDELRERRSARTAGRRRPRRGQRSGAAVQSLPRSRRGARARDALDRRGHGHRSHDRPRVHEEPDRRRWSAARKGHGVHVAGRPRQSRSGAKRPSCSTNSGSRSSRPRAPPRRFGRQASRSRKSSPSSTKKATTGSISSTAARSISSSTARVVAGPAPTVRTSAPRRNATTCRCSPLRRRRWRRRSACSTGRATGCRCARCRSTTAACGAPSSSGWED